MGWGGAGREQLCQISHPPLVLIIRVKLLLHIDSSGCTLPLSPIKWGERSDYWEPSGASPRLR